jgi:hypothetical protein
MNAVHLCTDFLNWNPRKACSLNSFIRDPTYDFLVNITLNKITRVRNNLSLFRSACPLVRFTKGISIQCAETDLVSQRHK